MCKILGKCICVNACLDSTVLLLYVNMLKTWYFWMLQKVVLQRRAWTKNTVLKLKVVQLSKTCLYTLQYFQPDLTIILTYFYEVASSYEFVRPHLYKFIWFLLNCTYFTSCQFVWISHLIKYALIFLIHSTALRLVFLYTENAFSHSTALFFHCI